MAYYHRNSEKRRILQDFRRHDEEVIGSLFRLSNRPSSPKTQMEQEKRIRREIANSNERRRMQSINAGFQSLKSLLPHHGGEKLSKAAILQQTSEYIYQLQQEKNRLANQNSQLKRTLNNQNNHDSDATSLDSPPPKRKKRDAESSDEGIGSTCSDIEEPQMEDIKRDMIDLRAQLDRERRLRLMLEEQTRTLEAQLSPERSRDLESEVEVSSTFIFHKKEQKFADTKIYSRDQEDNKRPDTVETPTTHKPLQTHHMYNSTRQNLEAIVEAIRHLEGDHMFRDDIQKPSRQISESDSNNSIETEDCKSKRSSPMSVTSETSLSQESIHRPSHIQYQRPAVIVPTNCL